MQAGENPAGIAQPSGGQKKALSGEVGVPNNCPGHPLAYSFHSWKTKGWKMSPNYHDRQAAAARNLARIARRLADSQTVESKKEA
jgi:hypothetical protein